MSVTDEVAKFRERVRGREVSSDRTLSQYISWIERYERWRGGREPTEQLMRDFDTYLEDESITDYPWESTRGRPAPDSYAYNTRVLALSAVKLWTVQHHRNDVRTEVQNIALGEPGDFDPNYVGMETIRDIIEGADEACPCDGCQAALKLSYHAILRGAELCLVRRSDVDLERGSLRVHSVKGSNKVRVSLDDEAVRLLRQHMNEYPDRDRLFHNTYGRPWKPNAWNNHFRRKHHEIGSHAFGRHSACVNRLQQGEEFGEIFRRARHQSPSMTIRYAKLVGVEPPEWAES